MRAVAQLARAGLVIAAMAATGVAAGAENPRYAEAAREHSHCAVFYTIAASRAEKNPAEFQELALTHARSATILVDRAYYDEQSKLALARLREDLKGDQAAVSRVIRRNVERCRDVLARSYALLGERARELQAQRDALGLHILFVELHPPYEKNRAALLRALKAEGYEAQAEGDREVTFAATAAQIGKLFGAKVVYRAVEKSATSGTASQPALEGARIPARFEKLMRRVYFDPQRG